MKVWLSRSRPGADRQARDLEQAGHETVVAPVIDIREVPGDPPGGPFDILIFLSEQAVHHGLPRLDPAGARLLAVGARTAAVLADAGYQAAYPEGADSEGLLALEALRAVRGRRVLLVCGADGRELLAAELAARGAEVLRFVCYRRHPVAALDPRVLGADLIAAASADGLARVAELWFAAGGRRDVPVLVPSERVRRRGVALGFASVHDCGGADSGALLRGLEHLQQTGPG